MKTQARVGAAVLLLVAFTAPASADDGAKRAREELERQLREMVKSPEASVVITFQALDEPNYQLEAVEFMLDGRILKTPPVLLLNREGVHRIHAGTLPEGRHELITRVTYVDASSVMLSEQAGFKWKVSGAARFETRRGLEVTVRAAPERIPGETDVRRQFRVRHHQDVKMVAEVDTSLPPPIAKAKPAAKPEPEPVAELEVAKPEPEPVVVAAAEVSEPERAKTTKAVKTKDKRKTTRNKTRRAEPKEEPEPWSRRVRLASATAEEASAETLPAAVEPDEPEPTAPVAEPASSPAPEPDTKPDVDPAVEVAAPAPSPAPSAEPDGLPVPLPVLLAIGAVVVLGGLVVVIRRRR